MRRAGGDAIDAPRSSETASFYTGVDAKLPPAEAELAKALDSVRFERVMIEFESPGPLGTPFAHNKLVALERRPGPTASLIKYLELTADGRPVMDGHGRCVFVCCF